jgi:hypothetical protein
VPRRDIAGQTGGSDGAQDDLSLRGYSLEPARSCRATVYYPPAGAATRILAV